VRASFHNYAKRCRVRWRCQGPGHAVQTARAFGHDRVTQALMLNFGEPTSSSKSHINEYVCSKGGYALVMKPFGSDLHRDAEGLICISAPHGRPFQCLDGCAGLAIAGSRSAQMRTLLSQL